MTERIPKIGFKIKSNSDPDSQYTNRTLAVTEATLEELQEVMEEHGFDNRSEALRYFLTIGMNSFVETDPRNKRAQNRDEGYTPLTIREILPDSKDDALDLREEEILDEVDKRLPEEIAEDPKIVQEGWEVWTKE